MYKNYYFHTKHTHTHTHITSRCYNHTKTTHSSVAHTQHTLYGSVESAYSRPHCPGSLCPPDCPTLTDTSVLPLLWAFLLPGYTILYYTILPGPVVVRSDPVAPWNTARGGGVIIYQNPKVPNRPRYYESMGKMRHKIPKH